MHFKWNNFFSSKNHTVSFDGVEKYCRAGETTDNSMAHPHCMLDI